jgi:hypothetical protein
VHGLEEASAGSISVGGRPVTAPDQTRAVIFQHFCFPGARCVRTSPSDSKCGGRMRTPPPTACRR